MISKPCSKCRIPKPLSDFSPNKGARDGLQSWCRACQGAWTNERRRVRRLTADGRRQIKAEGLRQWHGITIEQYDALLSAQHGLCAACGDVLGEKVHVDHCHTTDAIRGVLCGPCNQGLGYIREDADRARGLARYIELVCEPLKLLRAA